MAQEIEDAFQEKKVKHVAWIDLQRAFDKVGIDGLIIKLMRNGVANNMLESVLTNSAVGRSFYAKVSLKAVSYPRPSS